MAGAQESAVVVKLNRPNIHPAEWAKLEADEGTLFLYAFDLTYFNSVRFFLFTSAAYFAANLLIASTQPGGTPMPPRIKIILAMLECFVPRGRTLTFFQFGAFVWYLTINLIVFVSYVIIWAVIATPLGELFFPNVRDRESDGAVALLSCQPVAYVFDTRESIIFVRGVAIIFYLGQIFGLLFDTLQTLALSADEDNAAEQTLPTTVKRQQKGKSGRQIGPTNVTISRQAGRQQTTARYTIGSLFSRLTRYDWVDRYIVKPEIRLIVGKVRVWAHFAVHFFAFWLATTGETTVVFMVQTATDLLVIGDWYLRTVWRQRTLPVRQRSMAIPMTCGNVRLEKFIQTLRCYIIAKLTLSLFHWSSVTCTYPPQLSILFILLYFFL